MRRVALLVSLISARAAADPQPISATEPRPAQERPAPVEPGVPVQAPVSAADVAGAPVPGQESGRIDRGDGGDSPARVAARAALFVPRILFLVGFAPITGAVYVYNRYELKQRYLELFYSEDKTIGFYPTISYTTDIGLTIGGHYFMTDLAGQDEHLDLEALGGSSYHARFYASITSGRRLGPLVLQAFGDWQRIPNVPFFGIGNADEVDTLPAMTIDPIQAPLAISTRYREQLLRGALVADYWLGGSMHIVPSAALENWSFNDSSQNTTITDVYDPTRLAGFAGFSDVYGEVAARWDSRGFATTLEPRPVYSQGSLANVFGGRLFRFRGQDFWRYGADLQTFYRFAPAPRVLSLRFHGEAVSGNEEEVPFALLPRLGGWQYLRGYPLYRFRDRIAMVASGEYEWDLSEFLSTSLFIDVGRTYPTWSDFTLSGLRMGYGIQANVHSERNFLLQAGLASSIDGGVQTYLTFTSVFALDERVRRQ